MPHITAGKGDGRMDGMAGTLRAALRGELPPRYGEPYRTRFEAALRAALRDGNAILDIGAGRHPTIPMDERPAHTRYVALDPSKKELELAPDGSYDEVVVAGAGDPVAGLEGSFDLIVSWDVLEHVPDLERALINIQAYLRPGGLLVAQFAGRFAAHAILSRLVPEGVASRMVARLTGRPRDTVFQAHYDRCYYSALDGVLSSFRAHSIEAIYRDGGYFRFFRPALAAYLVYEDWACNTARRNLASHYLICGLR